MALQRFCLLRKFPSLASILYLILTPERETVWHWAAHGVGSQPGFRLGSKRKGGEGCLGAATALWLPVASQWKPDLARSKEVLGVPEMTRWRDLGGSPVRTPVPHYTTRDAGNGLWPKGCAWWTAQGLNRVVNCAGAARNLRPSGSPKFWVVSQTSAKYKMQVRWCLIFIN